MSEGGNVVIGALADRGKVRESNEDRSFYCSFELPGEGVLGVGILAAVADGMGGHAAGEAASERAVQVMQSRFCGLRDSAEGTKKVEDWASFLEEVIRQANSEVYEEAKRWKGREGMGTTITSAALINERLYVGHVGDSRAYLVREGSITQITEDDNWGAEQVRRGAMTPEQAARSERAGQLTKVLGIRPDVEVSVKVKKLSPGDIVLLCTDGLTGVVSDQEILEALRKSDTPQEACVRLVRLANRRGGPDNIAVLVINYNPQLIAKRDVVSPRSVRKKMLAGLAAVLVLLAMDILYLIFQYSHAPKPAPPIATSPRRFRSPVTVTAKPAKPAKPQPTPTSEAAVNQETSDGRQTPEEQFTAPPELTIRDMSGGVVTLDGGGDGE